MSEAEKLCDRIGIIHDGRLLAEGSLEELRSSLRPCRSRGNFHAGGGRVKLRNIAVVYRKELTDSLRDRRTVVSMIVVPIFLMPVLTIFVGVLSARLIGRALLQVPSIMVVGGENSPQILAALHALQDVQVVPASSDYAQQIVDKKIRAAVELPSDFDAMIARGETAKVRIDTVPRRNQFRIHGG